jgi:ribosome biogenesis GTPase
MEADQLHHYVHEFAGYEGKCRFNGCVHVNEPDCAVKSAVSQGLISPVRYDNYVEIYNELKTQRKY